MMVKAISSFAAACVISGLLVAGTASAAPADPAEASIDARGAASSLLNRVAKQPIRIVTKGESPFSLYLSPQGASEYKAAMFTRICKPPKGDKIQCWSRNGNGPWTKSQESALITSRAALVEVVVNRVAGFVDYGTEVSYDKTVKGLNTAMTLNGKFQGSGLTLRLSFAKNRASVGLYSPTFGSQPYESYSIRTVKAKKIVFPKN